MLAVARSATRHRPSGIVVLNLIETSKCRKIGKLTRGGWGSKRGATRVARLIPGNRPFVAVLPAIQPLLQAVAPLDPSFRIQRIGYGAWRRPKEAERAPGTIDGRLTV